MTLAGASVPQSRTIQRAGVLPLPRSHSDGFSVNARCVDEGTVERIVVTETNGREWEKAHPEGRGARLEE